MLGHGLDWTLFCSALCVRLEQSAALRFLPLGLPVQPVFRCVYALLCYPWDTGVVLVATAVLSWAACAGQISLPMSNVMMSTDLGGAAVLSRIECMHLTWSGPDEV